MSKSRKALFLENLLENPISKVQLSAAELPSIANGYEQKYEIKIYVNGETPFGKEKISQHEAEYNDLIQKLNDEKIKYAAYLSAFWKKGENRLRIDPDPYIWGIDKKFKKAIANFLDEDGYFKTNVNHNELANIIEPFTEFKKNVDPKISLAISVETYLKNDVGLNRKEVENEIHQIQQSLNQNEVVGYVYTNGHKWDQDHFDVLILAKNTIYRPADWKVDAKKKFSAPYFNIKDKFINAILDDFCNSEVTWRAYEYTGPEHGTPYAQATKIDCAALGLIYLKELLKNDAELLREYSLTIPYFDNNGVEIYFFFPPPQILRYSQSEDYNEVIKTMIERDSNEKIVFEKEKEKVHKKYTVETLAAILEKTKITAKDKPNREKIILECDRLLNQLPEFKNKWLTAYHEMQDQRQLMQDDKGSNRYLSFKSEDLRMKGKKNFEKGITQKTRLSSQSFSSKQQEAAPTQTNMSVSQNINTQNENPVTIDQLTSQPSTLLSSQSLLAPKQQEAAPTQTNMSVSQNINTQNKKSPPPLDQLFVKRVNDRQLLMDEYLKELKQIHARDTHMDYKKALADMALGDLLKGKFLTPITAELLKRKISIMAIQRDLADYACEKIDVELSKAEDFKKSHKF